MGNPFYGAIGVKTVGSKADKGGKRGIGSASVYRGIGLNIVDAMKDPRWRKYMLRQIAVLSGTIPGVGPFISQVLNAMADNPKIDFSQVMGEIFKVGVGKMLEMMATSIVSSALPPGISPVLANILKTGTSIGAMAGGKELGAGLIKDKARVEKVFRDARFNTETAIKRSQ